MTQTLPNGKRTPRARGSGSPACRTLKQLSARPVMAAPSWPPPTHRHPPSPAAVARTVGAWRRKPRVGHGQWQRRRRRWAPPPLSTLGRGTTAV